VITGSSDAVYFDAWMQRDLHHWLLYYPDQLLSWESFFNILAAGPVVCQPDTLYPRHLEAGRWAREVKELQTIGKIIIHPHPTEQWEFSFYRLATAQRFEGLVLDDLIALGHCIGDKLPFRLSQSGTERIGVVAPAALTLAGQSADPVASTERSLSDIIRWIVQIEVPELEKRSEELRKAYLDRAYETLLQTGKCDLYQIGGTQTHFLQVDSTAYTKDMFLSKVGDYLAERVYLSPPELIDLLRHDRALSTLREVVRECRSIAPTHPDVRALLKEKWDQRAGRLRVGEHVFTGIQMALLALPFGQAIGPAAEVLKYVVNRWLDRPADWLLTLNSFNRQLRRSDPHQAQ
jgi:hypothetical protein